MYNIIHVFVHVRMCTLHMDICVYLYVCIYMYITASTCTCTVNVHSHYELGCDCYGIAVQDRYHAKYGGLSLSTLVAVFGVNRECYSFQPHLFCPVGIIIQKLSYGEEG